MEIGVEMDRVAGGYDALFEPWIKWIFGAVAQTKATIGQYGMDR